MDKQVIIALNLLLLAFEMGKISRETFDYHILMITAC